MGKRIGGASSGMRGISCNARCGDIGAGGSGVCTWRYHGIEDEVVDAGLDATVVLSCADAVESETLLASSNVEPDKLKERFEGICALSRFCCEAC